MHEELLSRELLARIEKLAGTKVESYRRVAGGYTPALRLLCRTNKTSFFVKIGATVLTSASLRREIRVYNCLRSEFMPRLLACEDHESAPILIIEDLSQEHWPPPPWSERQVELTLAQINALHNTPTVIQFSE